MSTTSLSSATIDQPISLPTGKMGPETRARIVRTLVIYALLVAIGSIPLLLNAGASWKAAGLGLWLPGGGFLAVGGWSMLLFPATLLFFMLAFFFWFGAGAVIAPPIVWLVAAVAAGALAGETILAPAPYLIAGLGVGFVALTQYQRHKTISAKTKIRDMRVSVLPKAIADAHARAIPAPAPGERELSPEELASLRYGLDRALQPIDQWRGFDVIDQFQTSALRYQINFISYLLSEAQTHYTPSFHGYLSQAQRMLIDRYLQRKVWNYWAWEASWGHLNLTNWDPAAKDNIMLTAFFGRQVCLYMSATGDRRYEKPGSLPFRFDENKTFEHDIHTIEKSVIDNFRQSAFCLYPCEPNWLYPFCNHYGMTSLVIYDRLFGTDYTQSIRDRWLESLDTELTDASGSVVGVRSTYLGFEFAFFAGDMGLAPETHLFAPDRAWRQWASGRIDLERALAPGADGKLRLMIPEEGFDPGNYRVTAGGAFGAIAQCAREFGDEELANACLLRLNETGGRSDVGGVISYAHLSNNTNIRCAHAKIRRKGFYRDSFVNGPPESVFKGPLLTEAEYPKVLVAKAFSDGENLDLVLYPGAGAGTQTIGVERLTPGRQYHVSKSNNDDEHITADPEGKATLSLTLDGRTAVILTPMRA